MQINNVGLIGNHFQSGTSERIRMIVMHSTAARGPGDFNYLRRGGSDARPVSIHYYIDKAGSVSQMVADKDIAWQAGASTWKVDGKFISPSCNPISIGIELENLNTGRDPYPQAQYAAALDLVRYLVSKYNVPRRQLVRHLDIAPKRKTDPAGFPWERFVAEVYSAGPAPTPPPAAPPVPAPQPQPLQPTQQLRKLLVDLAYRAAGGAHPAGWPLLKDAISKSTGMPINVLTPPPSGDGQGEDEQQRAVVVAGQPLILEGYGRDLYYATPDTPEQVQRLSATPAGPLRDALLGALFQSVDPVKGFRPDQAFHQFYLNHMTEIGVPIGPDHILPGGKISCQHYALDTLIWTGKVTRLSDLTRNIYSGDPHPQPDKDLRTAVLNDLYMARTGRNFDPNALFCKYAIAHAMGAPMGKAEIQMLEGKRLVAMPYALDVLYCQIPADGDWSKIVIGEMPAVLGDEADNQPSQLSVLLQQGDVDDDGPMVLGEEEDVEEVLPKRIFTGGLLGVEASAPAIVDLSQSVSAQKREADGTIDRVIVYSADGPANTDLAAAGQPAGRLFNYYVDTAGMITKLADESAVPRAARAGDAELDQRSIAVGVEPSGSAMADEQAAALAWLLRDLGARYGLSRGHIVQGADVDMGESLPDWDRLFG